MKWLLFISLIVLFGCTPPSKLRIFDPSDFNALSATFLSDNIHFFIVVDSVSENVFRIFSDKAPVEFGLAEELVKKDMRIFVDPYDGDTTSFYVRAKCRHEIFFHIEEYLMQFYEKKYVRLFGQMTCKYGFKSYFDPDRYYRRN